MKRNRLFRFLLLSLLCVGFKQQQGQTMQVALSYAPNDNRSTSKGTATIFFDSSIEDLSVVCTDENPDEPIVKVGENLWCMYIDTKKDIDYDDVCYRNFLIHSPSSEECYITTPIIEPNQVLYYSINPKLKVKLSTDNKVDMTASDGKASVFFDCRMKDVSIICIDGATEETINKITERFQIIHIDVNKDLKTNNLCVRTFVLKRGQYPILIFRTGPIRPHQVLYYTVLESEELETQLMGISVLD